MPGEGGAACRSRLPDRTMPLRFLGPTLARTAGHDIRHWALGIHWLLGIGHWSLPIGQRPWTGGQAPAFPDGRHFDFLVNLPGMDPLLKLLHENAALKPAHLAVMLNSTEADVTTKIKAYEADHATLGYP